MFSEHLSQAENWLVTLAILLLMGGSVFCHIGAHLYVARIRQDKKPKELAIFIFGDAAQSWPLAASAWNEIVTASAGPLTNILFSGIACLLWNRQLNIYINLIALFMCVFNGWLFIINLLPAFPMDGGRIIRASLQGVITPPCSVTILIRRFGFVIALALTGWGIILYIQNPNFGPQTALFTFPLVILLMDGLRIRPGVEEDATANGKSDLKSQWLRLPGVVLLALIMMGVFSTPLMTNSGLEAPGAGVSIEPMVNVPSQYRFNHTGTFILTTISIRAPIFVGEWLQAQIDPTKLVVAPKKTTPQELARQDFQMLQDSEATAITVGLRRVGYPSDMIGRGARVDTILPEGRANGILQTGDVITAVNSTPIRTMDDFMEKINALSGNSPVQLAVERGQVKMDLTVPVLQPDLPSDTPKIGITAESDGFDLNSPFPISITTQEISGGSSAGLMFTLTVYNAALGARLNRREENRRHRYHQPGWNRRNYWRRKAKSDRRGSSRRKLFSLPRR